MAVRIRSRWFRKNRPHTPAELAGVMALNLWRLACDVLKHMRKAGFSIDPGPAYFSFLAEWLVFLAYGADRLVFSQLDPADRHVFVSTLVRRLAEILADNQRDLMGLEGLVADEIRARFIETFNTRGEDYGEQDFQDGVPDYGFLRVLAYGVVAVVPETDRHWVHDQVMEIEAPQAIEAMGRGIQGLLSDYRKQDD